MNQAMIEVEMMPAMIGEGAPSLGIGLLFLLGMLIIGVVLFFVVELYSRRKERGYYPCGPAKPEHRVASFRVVDDDVPFSPKPLPPIDDDVA
ncbi:TPA: hypothetical protein DF272_06830 [Candidatus Falkowbacteria bacterium]|nr:hypothetical protein [Candidatus Falkowbacteria bacterium]